MNGTNKNLEFWEEVSKTDPDYTSDANTGGYNHTAINAIYMVKQATKMWGPIGDKWGYKIITERNDKGLPISIGENIIHEETHTILLELYHPAADGGEPATLQQFGHTPRLSYSKNQNRFYEDKEAPKKSLTDALKKCLSLVGVCADIYMGEFDNPEYVKEARHNAEIAKSSDAEKVIDEAKLDLIMYRDKQAKDFELITLLAALGQVRGIAKKHIIAECNLLKLDYDKFMQPLDAAYSKQKQVIENKTAKATTEK